MESPKSDSSEYKKNEQPETALKKEETSLLVETAFAAESNTVPEESEFQEKLPDDSNTAKNLSPKSISIKRESNLDDIFKAIEGGFPQESTKIEYVFPHPRYWIGPRFMAFWALPIILIKSFINLIKSSNPVRPYKESEYTIKKSETIYTSARKALDGSHPMRFFGARFITIWVLPLAITGIFMQYLFVGPLIGRVPF